MDQDRTDAILKSIQSLKSANSETSNAQSSQQKKALPLPTRPPQSTKVNSTIEVSSSINTNITSASAPSSIAKGSITNSTTTSVPRVTSVTTTQRLGDTLPKTVRNAAQTPLQTSQPQSLKRNRAFTKNHVIVSPRQKGNPLLNNLVSIPWEWGDITPDYLPNSSCAVLFLSLKYHRLHPEYILRRMGKLFAATEESKSKFQQLKILLVQVDIENHADALRELTMITISKGFTMLLAWNEVEAGMYISLLKHGEEESSLSIRGKIKDDYETRLVDAMGKIKGVNKKDGLSMITAYGSLKRAFDDNGATLEALDGWGAVKVKRFHDTITEPFVYNRTYPERDSQSGSSYETNNDNNQ